MSDAPEKQAIISGIGISRIGRKTDFGHLDLTTESATAAIADAGLRPEDIDGIATMGETPLRGSRATPRRTKSDRSRWWEPAVCSRR